MMGNDNNTGEYTSSMNTTKNLFAGLLVGGIVGAATMLLFAPHSGKQTREQIQLKSIELRDRTSDQIKKAAENFKSETNRITTEVQKKAGDLKQLGQDELVKQMDRMSDALDVGKTAVKDA